MWHSFPLGLYEETLPGKTEGGQILSIADLSPAEFAKGFSLMTRHKPFSHGLSGPMKHIDMPYPPEVFWE
jgi:hypothetical protein